MKTFLKECKWGTFLLLRGDLISQYIDIYGEWSELEVALFNDLLDTRSNVIEVGSNIGAHAIPISRFAHDGKVVCFEPQRVLFQLLCANAALNNRTNIYAFQNGVGSKEYNFDIQCTNYDVPWNYGSFSLNQGFDTENKFQGTKWSERVEVVCLDTHPLTSRLDSLNLLKIDAEGMELEVLAGAKKTIAKHSPAIFVENNRPATGNSLIAELQSIGYTCFWYGTERAIPDNYNRVAIKIPGADLNMICFRNEKIPPALSFVEARSMADLETGTVAWIKRKALDAPD